MDKMALINGKMVELDEKSKTDAENFHKHRIAFAWVGGQLVLNTDPYDDRDHHHWITEDYDITVEEFEKIPRGYMMHGKIQLFTGSTFSPISGDELRLPMSDLIKLRDVYKKDFWTTDTSIPVYNGVRVGRVGDIWPPIQQICTLNLSPEIHSKEELT